MRAVTRAAELQRETKETTIDVALVVDGTRHARASSTGIPFFDHMLEQLGKHGGLRPRRIEAKGDLEVDLHHTVEDVGIVLGTALREALGDKRGRAPVRERARAARRGARAGRARPLGPPVPRLRRSTRSSEWIGTFDPQLAEEFWKGFVDGARVTLHLRSARRARTGTT